jgi:putative ABC transport system permease protein
VGNLLSDVRYCLRGFARRPLFAAVVVVTLALGLSVNATIFSVYDQVLLRELPVSDPDGLVNLESPGPKQGNSSCNDGGTCDEVFSYPMFRDLERIEGPFTGIAAHRYTDASLAFEGETATGSALLVSGQYFSLLGVTPAAGRLLDTNDDRVDGEASAVVLTHAYWESALGADPNVVGRALVVNGKPLTIVGVGPRDFYGTTVGERPLVFVPITFRWLPNPAAFPQHADRKSYWAYLFARLKPGVSLEQAAAAINVPYRAINNEVDVPLVTGASEQVLDQFRAKTVVLTPGERGQSRIDDNARTELGILLVSTGLVLLIACVNVANLLLARGSTRVGEIAVRASLGASRVRLLSLLLVETLLLAVAAVLVSTPLTMSALRGIEAMLPPSNRVLDLALDGTVVATTLGLAVLSTFVFGLIPALKLIRLDVNPAQQTQGARQTGGKAAARFRATLTTAQIALSMTLLVLAGWFAQSLANVARVDLGFRAESLAAFTIAPERNGYTAEQSAALFTRLEEELAQMPGVTAAGAAGVALLDNSNWNGNVSVEGFEAAPETDTNVSMNFVSPEFFRTLEMPLTRGTGLERAASDGPPVAVVNERFVEKFALGDGAVGTRMAFGSTQDLNIEIVGVVRDAKYSEVKADPPPQVFRPRAQVPFLGEMTFYLRSNLGALELRSAVMGVLARHDANLPLINFLTVPQQARENIFLDRFMGTLASALAAMAVLLAGVGIYGVLSYGVAQRLREIGLRIALGAAPRRVRGMVLKQVGWMAAIGIVIGVGLALLLGQVGRALLFGLAPNDPAVPAVAVLSLLAVVAAAAYWPARRAALVDPVTALRGD